MHYVRNYFLALLVVGLAYGGYSLAVAPWLEPPSVTAHSSTSTSTRPASVAPANESFAGLFQKEDWESDNPKVIETSQCTLLLKDYKIGADGSMSLQPCTLIFYREEESPTASDGAITARSLKKRRPIVMRAPQGAELKFDRPINLGAADFGKLVGGKLNGQITVFSPPSAPGIDDALLLTTRGFTLDKERAYTPSEVDLKYGRSFGHGRDLTIELFPSESGNSRGSKSPAFGGIRLLTLNHVERLHWEAGADGSTEEAESLFGPSAEKNPPLEIRCQGALVVDFEQRVVLLDNKVEINRVYRKGPPDRLTCERLQVHLVPLPTAEQEASAAQAAGKEVATKAGTKKAAKPLADQIEKILAVGTPVVLDAPQSRVQATAGTIKFEPVPKRLSLLAGTGSPQVTLNREGSRFQARELEYQLGEEGRLGKLWAAGPGRLEVVQTNPEAAGELALHPSTKTFIATWQKELRMQPHEQNQVISLLDGAQIQMDESSRFQAKEIHFWVTEVPLPATTESSGRNGVAPGKQKFQIVPDRMLAAGDVVVESPQLTAQTARLEAWFIDPPQKAPLGEPAGGPTEAPPASNPLLPNSSLSAPFTQASRERVAESLPSPTVRRAIPGQVEAPLPAAPQQKYAVAGHLVQMNLLRLTRTPVLEDLTIKGQVRVDEMKSGVGGEPQPLRILGDTVALHSGSSSEAQIDVTGKPAQVSARGLSIAGATIHLHKGKNRVWIDGPGEAYLPLPTSTDALNNKSIQPPTFPQPAPPVKKAHITWQGGMTFDGLKIRLEQQVEARTDTQFVTAEILDAELLQKIDFSKLGEPREAKLPDATIDGSSLTADLKSIAFAGERGVHLENIGLDLQGKQESFDTLEARSVNIDRLSGKLRAEGPGEVTTVRNGTGALPGQPAIPVSPAANGLAGAPKKTFVSVKFQGSIAGDLNRHEVQFQNQVETTYGQVDNWHDRINATRLEDLGPSGAKLYSDTLTLVEMSLPNLPKWVELDARGNTLIEGISFTARAFRIGYTSDKDKLVLEGDGRTDAELWHRRGLTSESSYTAARKISFRRKNGKLGELQVDDARTLDIGSLPDSKKPIPVRR